MTCFVAALPPELKALTRGWEPVPASRPGVLLFRGPQAAAVCAGMGGERAAIAVDEALRAFSPTRLVSVGLAGACDPALRVGDVVSCSTVIDVRSGERFAAEPSTFGPVILATGPAIASVPEKQRLRETYNAQVIDMEASTVGRLARAHGLPFSAIKSISDDSSFSMEELSHFADGKGQFQTGLFALSILARPWRWPFAVTLGRNSSRALQTLTAALNRDLASH